MHRSFGWHRRKFYKWQFLLLVVFDGIEQFDCFQSNCKPNIEYDLYRYGNELKQLHKLKHSNRFREPATCRQCRFQCNNLCGVIGWYRRRFR